MPEGVAPRSSLRRRLVWSLIGATLVVLAGLVLLGPDSDLLYVCGKCSKARRSRGKRLALVHFQVYVSHHEEETTLSRFLNSSGIVGKHEHDWLLMGGTDGGNCVDGAASCLGSLMGSETAVRFLGALHRHVGVDAARKWTALLIDTGTHSSWLREQLDKEKLPAGAYEDGGAFRAWWQEHSGTMEKAMADKPRLSG